MKNFWRESEPSSRTRKAEAGFCLITERNFMELLSDGSVKFSTCKEILVVGVPDTTTYV